MVREKIKEEEEKRRNCLLLLLLLVDFRGKNDTEELNNQPHLQKTEESSESSEDVRVAGQERRREGGPA